MHTTIKKRLTVNEVFYLSDHCDTLNVRMYETKEPIPNSQDIKLLYELNIRHTKEENPKKLLKKALKIYKNSEPIFKEIEKQLLAIEHWKGDAYQTDDDVEKALKKIRKIINKVEPTF
jgi:predicted  nucleic acid-binding Zn-ribbon protein